MHNNKVGITILRKVSQSVDIFALNMSTVIYKVRATILTKISQRGAHFHCRYFHFKHEYCRYKVGTTILTKVSQRGAHFHCRYFHFKHEYCRYKVGTTILTKECPFFL